MMKVEIRRSMYGRKLGYRAWIGSVYGDGKTKTEAQEAAVREAAEVLDGEWEPYVVVAHGYIGVVYRVPNGWEYFVQEAERFTQGKGAHSACTTFLNTRDRKKAIRSMLHGLIQRVGPEALHLAGDDEELRRELERYFESVPVAVG